MEEIGESFSVGGIILSSEYFLGEKYSCHLLTVA